MTHELNLRDMNAILDALADAHGQSKYEDEKALIFITIGKVAKMRSEQLAWLTSEYSK